ncbi:MAG: hypothetical protein R3D33_07015 [Hyphomicrobiaceae bacterium]
MNVVRILTVAATMATLVVVVDHASAFGVFNPPGRGGGGPVAGGGGGGGGTGGGSTGGGGQGAPIPLLGATALGQAVALGGGVLMWRRRRKARGSEQQPGGPGADSQIR